MPLKLYDSKDAVPETLRESAIETKDGKFAVEEGAPDVAGLRTALDSERARAADEEKKRKAAEKKAADLEREKNARAAGVSEEELQKIRDAEALARKPIEDERDRLAADNRKLRLTDRVRTMYLTTYGGMPDRVEDALDQLEKRTDLGDAGGIVFKDKDGKVTADDAAAFFAKFKLEKPWLFQGSGASGSGATGSNGAGGTLPTADSTTTQARRAAVHAGF